METREALITMIPRIIRNIMTDIPQAFVLPDDGIHRKDSPTIPRKAIREAVCNTLMHRDYTYNQPVQIRRYVNRIEFANAGYSLKPEEELGLPGSITRNNRIAAILHEINIAETKGTGIRTMRDLMRGANLTLPLIESSRETNQFTLTFLTHHLFDKQDIEWLKFFKEYNLSNDDARTLIVVREMGAITNADYRMINGVDTLSASAQLRRLRDFGLLEQKGRGNATYYVPTQKLIAPTTEASILPVMPISGELTPQTSPISGELTPQTSPISGELASSSGPQTGDLPTLPKRLPALSDELRKKIADLRKKTSTHEIKELIKELCALQPLRLKEISMILGRHPKYIRDDYLNDLIKNQELEYAFSDPNHPQQAYKIKK